MVDSKESPGLKPDPVKATAASVTNGAPTPAPAPAAAKVTKESKEMKTEESAAQLNNVLVPAESWPPPIYINHSSSQQEKFYMEHRWHAQWNWYDKRASFFKGRYLRIQLGVAFGAAIVPALVAITPQDPNLASILRYLAIAISLIVTILTAWETVYKHGDNWRTFRAAAEELGREKALYDMGAGNYRKAKQPFIRFVERCEEIIAKQNGQWLQAQEQVTDEQGGGKKERTGRDERDDTP